MYIIHAVAASAEEIDCSTEPKAVYGIEDGKRGGNIGTKYIFTG